MKILYQKLFATSVLAIVILFAVTGSAFASSSFGPQRSSAQVAKACSPTYTVKQGDKIKSISKKCKVSQKAVIRANGGSKQLSVGTVLYFGGSASAGEPTPAPRDPRPEPFSGPAPAPYNTDKGPLPTPNS